MTPLTQKFAVINTEIEAWQTFAEAWGTEVGIPMILPMERDEMDIEPVYIDLDVGPGTAFVFWIWRVKQPGEAYTSSLLRDAPILLQVRFLQAMPQFIKTLEFWLAQIDKTTEQAGKAPAHKVVPEILPQLLGEKP